MDNQLTFELPIHVSSERVDFFVSESNKMAVQMIDDWENWPGKKHLLVGPKFSGKSHIARIWAFETGSTILSASDIHDPINIAHTKIVIEDLDKIAGDFAAEENFLHLHNICQENDVFMLITGTNSPNTWNIKIADLASRLAGIRQAIINNPDDTLFTALLTKLFRDRQINPSPKILNFLLVRLERSYEGAFQFVCAADKMTLAKNSPLSFTLAKEILETISPNHK